MRGLGTKLTVLLLAVLAALSGSLPPPGEPLSSAPVEALAAIEAAADSTSTPTPIPSPSPGPSGVPRPTPTPERVASPAQTPQRTEQKPATSKHALPVALPRQIRIPAIGVEAGFEFVGRTADGAMDVPRDPDRVAWYRLGPRPGEQGNAVVAGHVDWGGKPAVFWALSQLKAGDLVEIIATDDKKYQFSVQWQRWFEADGAPVQEIFSQGGAAELTAITCGGHFDQRTRQYSSRLVLRAVLR